MIIVFFKQNTAYEMRIGDWSSDVCSADLNAQLAAENELRRRSTTRVYGTAMKTIMMAAALFSTATYAATTMVTFEASTVGQPPSDWTCGATGKGTPHWGVETDTSAPSGEKVLKQSGSATYPWCVKKAVAMRSEEHTSELQSLMRNS